MATRKGGSHATPQKDFGGQAPAVLEIEQSKSRETDTEELDKTKEELQETEEELKELRDERKKERAEAKNQIKAAEDRIKGVEERVKGALASVDYNELREAAGEAGIELGASPKKEEVIQALIEGPAPEEV